MICTHTHTHICSSTAFDEAVEEQEKDYPEPYDSFLTNTLKRIVFGIKWRVLRYVFRVDILGHKCLPSDGSKGWLTKQERRWMLCKSKWARRLLVFFTDQTLGEIEHAEQWTIREPVDDGTGLVRRRSTSEISRDRRASMMVLQDEISEILKDTEKMKMLEREEFGKILNIAVRPEVYPLYEEEEKEEERS